LQPSGIAGEKRGQGRNCGHDHPGCQSCENDRKRHLRDVRGKDQREGGGHEEKLRTDQNAARIEPVYQHPGEGGPDEHRRPQTRHQQSLTAGRRVELVSGLAPDPDEEGGLASGPRDETSCHHARRIGILDQEHDMRLSGDGRGGGIRPPPPPGLLRGMSIGV
jgi:hypothetical protein